MVALRIEDMKVFTKKLFIGETFDRFLVREASIVTFNSFTIDGRVRDRGITPKRNWRREKLKITRHGRRCAHFASH